MHSFNWSHFLHGLHDIVTYYLVLVTCDRCAVHITELEIRCHSHKLFCMVFRKHKKFENISFKLITSVTKLTVPLTHGRFTGTLRNRNPPRLYPRCQEGRCDGETSPGDTHVTKADPETLQSRDQSSWGRQRSRDVSSACCVTRHIEVIDQCQPRSDVCLRVMVIVM